MKAQIQARMDEIKKAIEESVVNHNCLLARYAENEVMLKLAEDAPAEAVVEAVEVLEGDVV